MIMVNHTKAIAPVHPKRDFDFDNFIDIKTLHQYIK